MGTIAARDARTIVEIAQNVAAIHVIAICQALELRGIEQASPAARRVHALIRTHVPFLSGDRRMDADVAAVVELIRDGALSRAALGG
jgi:histidine ammonia-lyase